MRFFSFILFCLLSYTVLAQPDYSGRWEGIINDGTALHLVFQIDTKNGSYQCEMDSPDQGAYKLKADTIFIRNDSLVIIDKKIGYTYYGKLLNDSMMNGKFQQGIKLPLPMKRLLHPRPQTPKSPFSYESEDVTYYNADSSIRYGATITYPSVPADMNYVKPPVYPIVVLISGSGQQNRDEEIFQHKPFAVIADHLTKNGFLVIRVDDRGTGKSTGNFSRATSADFADDVTVTIDYIKKFAYADSGHITLAGHSEGGMIAPMIAQRRKDIKALILLAAPGIPIIDLMTEQNVAILTAGGIDKKTGESYGKLYHKILSTSINETNQAAAKNIAETEMKNWLKGTADSSLKLLGIANESQQTNLVNTLLSVTKNNWYKYFLSYNPQPVLRNLKNMDVLAVNGEKDIQVIAESNLNGIEKSLRKSKVNSYKTIVAPGLNHLFQHCYSCTVSEYGLLTETFSKDVLNLMSDWLKTAVQKK